MMSVRSGKAMKKIRWDIVWAVYFALCLATFAVMLMLQLTNTIHISWWWIVAPLLLAMFTPAIVVLVAAIAAVLKDREVHGYDRRE